VAAGAARLVNAASRALGRGQGTVAGGRVALALDPGLVGRLARGRPVGVVSGTNGKTTTTALLAAALEGSGAGPVVSNDTGSNMPAGHAAALARGPHRGPVVLEVDEGYLPGVLDEVSPAVAVLLNLSRDQLDRTNEVRMVAGRWRRALEGRDLTVVANADDPLIVFAASGAPRVVWVAAGGRWRADAAGCPSCGGRIEGGTAWACACGFARPAPDAWLEEEGATPVAVLPGGRRVPLSLALPGRFNRANALMAAVAAIALGAEGAQALAAQAAVGQVAGRFTTPVVAGVPTRLLLAKNPAGWAELLDLLSEDDGPVVVGINARTADGHDPSWLWDVPFEELAGREVVATGERARDLAVRLHYAEVAHETVPDQLAAVTRAARHGRPVEYVGNYTAFHDLLARA
jgi:UDP-N-acetylmuramyl tripeptide synthase